MAEAVPTHLPPAAGTAIQKEIIQTAALSTDDLHLLQTAAANQAVPARAVEGVAKQAAHAASTTWQSQKTIVNQWTINQDRNSWIGVAGIGWQKLSTASDSGCVSLTMLSSNALISKASVNYRQEADGMVHEIYVF
jgi:hypothetical protein